MENQRLFLIIALVFLGLMLFQEWQKDYGDKPTARQPAATQAPAGAVPSPGTAATVPQDVPVASAAPAEAPKGPVISGEGNKLPRAQRVSVRTDTLSVEIDSYGGDIRRVDLLKYPETLDKNSEPTRLMTDEGARLFVAQSGFSMVQGEGPNHETRFTAQQSQYQLDAGQDRLQVDLTWTSANGMEVVKSYIFHRGSHAIELQFSVRNGTGEDWKGSFYRQMQRTQYGETTQSSFIYTYMGGVIYTPEERYEKIDFADMQKENLHRDNILGGWITMMQHYFLGAWIPAADEVNTFYSKYLNYRYYLGMISPVQTIGPGQQHVFKSQYYIGPKIQKDLEKLAEGLELTVDYGALTVIAKPLFWILKVLHKLTNNWGWAIILVTVLIKLLFYKLSETSYRSMANMRKMQPRMQALKERFGDDKQKLNQAMMELYKKEKINPLGGCLPILIQIPVFIALYWVLLESVELRQAPFIFWIRDLSAQDPYFVLPLVMGVTMFIQQKLNPAPIDPLQAKIMMFLPIVFTVFFLFFPSGLVLYWVVNNTLSIAQQWVITKRIEGSK